MINVIYLGKDSHSFEACCKLILLQMQFKAMIDIDLLLTKGAVYKKVKANEIIFTEGQLCNYYFQVVSGSVRWLNIDEEGKECIHAIVEAGESFGELPLFDNGQYQATAIANVNSVLIRLYKPVFLNMLKENTDLLFDFTKLLTKRLRFKFSVIQSMSTNSPETRITNLIKQFKTEHRNFCSDCGQLTLTRKQIACMTGLRVETVIRTIRHMHSKGVLNINRGKVFCKDMIE